MRPSMDDARRVLARTFGYPAFRPGQVDVVQSVLDGRDTLGVLPTGGGKSLCYQVPALLRDGITIVISPLISLMKDQVERLVSRGVAATFLNSTLPADETARRLRAVERGIVKLLYVAPERFGDARVLAAVRQTSLALLAVDEAHCISEWGHEFRPSFRRIAEHAAAFSGLQVMALTATATPAVRRDITQQLRMRTPRIIVSGFDRPNLSYAVLRCRNDDAKRGALLRTLGDEPGLAVVYVSTRADVRRVTRELGRARIRCAGYHGGLPHARRVEAQDAFMRETVQVIVATNAFGMGIDKPNVRLVVHYALPGTLEGYYQEAGRAGRDGQPGRCVLLYSAGDRDTHDYFIRSAFPDPDSVRQVFRALQDLADAGRVPREPAAVARQARVLPNEATAAMRWLEQQGALRRGDQAALHVRLLALPERIRSELAEGSGERQLLRRLWRAAGSRLFEGLTVAMPARERWRQLRALQALRERQFVACDLAPDTLRLRHPSATLDALGIDLDSLRRRRQAEIGKLERVIAYAESARCRRGLLLGYFGEQRTRTACDGCDNCLGARDIRSGRPTIS